MRGHVSGRREAIARQPEGGLHDQDIRGPQLSLLGGETFAQLEIAGVQQGGAVAFAGDVQHRRANHMAGRQQDELEISQIDRLAQSRQNEAPIPRRSRPLLHQQARQLRANRQLVPSDVVAVRMGHEGALDRERRVEPQAGLRQVNAAVVADGEERHGVMCRIESLPVPVGGIENRAPGTRRRLKVTAQT